MIRFRLWLVAIILTGLALRLYNLTYHSLWFDEAMSIHWARQSVPRILEVGFNLVEDRLPPLYYLGLKGWATLLDYREATVRGLSVIFGLLLIPTTARIALLLFNRRLALVTAVLVAFNPFLIWYSQEARMYAPAAFFSVFTVWVFLQFCRQENPPVTNNHSLFIIHSSSFIILFSLAATAALYNHLYAGFVLPALGLWLIVSYPRHLKLWLMFASSGLIITLAFAPIALAIWRFSAEASPGNPVTGLAQRAWWLLHAFTIWKAPLPATLNLFIPGLVSLFVGLAYLRPRSSRSTDPLANLSLSQRFRTARPTARIPRPLLLVSLLLVTPFAMATVLLVRNHLAFFGARYFIVMTPWLLLLAAVGAGKLSDWLSRHLDRRVSGLPFILLFIPTLWPIPGQWSPAAAKEAWRQSAHYLARQATASDAILIHPDWVRYPLQYYFQGPGQTYAAFSHVTSGISLDGPLQGVVGDHTVLWLVQSHLDGPDPNRLVEQWLATRYPLVTELHPPGIIIKAYGVNYQLESLPPEVRPVNLQFDNGMRLVGYEADRIATATDQLFHPPSGWVHVTLYWTADRPVITDAIPFVNLVGPEGIWGASLERPNDALKFYPPSQWAANRSGHSTPPFIRHDLDVNLNPLTPSGTYQLLVGLHGDETQYPLTEIEIRGNAD